MTKEQFAKEQPVAYRILSHALRSQKIAHAYLFHGPKGTNKLDSAILFAQSLLCPHCDTNGFACEQCVECIRIKERKFADMIILDGSTVSIKKENILKLQHEFQKTGLEHTGKKIYILNYAENATSDALNSLLKFLEEPTDDMVAILLVEQTDRLLPTILSRCQMIPFQPLTFAACFQIAKETMGELDAYLISAMMHSPSGFKDVCESKEYAFAKQTWQEFLTAFLQSPYYGLAALLKAGVDNKKADGKRYMRYLLEMLMLFYRDLIQKDTACHDAFYTDMIKAYQEKAYPYAVLLEIALETNDKLWKSVNLTLLCDQMVYRMKEAVK